MTTQLEKLYTELSTTKLFERMPECEECNYKCNSKIRERWLLKEEAERLKGHFVKFVDIDGRPFLEEGLCSKLKEGKCSIYDVRPLECRLAPVRLLAKDSRVYWILGRPCKMIEGNNVAEINMLKKKAILYIDQESNPFLVENITAISLHC